MMSLSTNEGLSKLSVIPVLAASKIASLSRSPLSLGNQRLYVVENALELTNFA